MSAEPGDVRGRTHDRTWKEGIVKVGDSNLDEEIVDDQVKV